ncbi:3-deoxy-D-manno-octulosonic acid transferase [Variovorax sp. OV329]|uniref:3-deoxy-D-manno-octulosonic acid transferase n=1 Tax=Variovorax sp. OV329 TaxID=1882825 RepID=UPI0008E5F6EC|nr:3-deoxy-D-manno-octulosonic acid transferase [Variovorax sp. OV329]SFL91453.1 3-deoxy-D-manno-octulosonic-acid transferase [Variovorax sp. OV329]
MHSLLLRLYGAATWLLQPMLRRKLRRRAVAEPGYAIAVEERFGHYDEAISGTGWVWIHAVSLGETRAAGILIDALRHQDPSLRVLLTNGTATGREEGARLLGPNDLQIWQPWDTPEVVRRFLDRFRPRIGILMETEIWPVLTAECARRGIPLVLANARLNEKSLASAKRLAWIARPTYASLAAVWAQTEADSHRLVSAGARVDGVFGNLKFDATPDSLQLGRSARLREKLPKPVVVFASSRDGEERQLLEVLQHLRHSPPVGWSPAAGKKVHLPIQSVQWMIVPRHPQRFDEVASLIESKGFVCARRSAQAAAEGSDTEIWLGDSLGEMALYYGLADVALLGGSFEPLGGQNLIEAAACGCPIIMGPSTFNFAEAAELSLAGGASMRVDDMEEAVVGALTLLADPVRQNTMVQAALTFSSAHRGAAARTAAAIGTLLARQPEPSLSEAREPEAA